MASLSVPTTDDIKFPVLFLQRGQIRARGFPPPTRSYALSIGSLLESGSGESAATESSPSPTSTSPLPRPTASHSVMRTPLTPLRDDAPIDEVLMTLPSDMLQMYPSAASESMARLELVLCEGGLRLPVKLGSIEEWRIGLCQKKSGELTTTDKKKTRTAEINSCGSLLNLVYDKDVLDLLAKAYCKDAKCKRVGRKRRRRKSSILKDRTKSKAKRKKKKKKKRKKKRKKGSASEMTDETVVSGTADDSLTALSDALSDDATDEMISHTSVPSDDCEYVEEDCDISEVQKVLNELTPIVCKSKVKKPNLYSGLISESKPKQHSSRFAEQVAVDCCYVAFDSTIRDICLVKTTTVKVVL